MKYYILALFLVVSGIIMLVHRVRIDGLEVATEYCLAFSIFLSVAEILRWKNKK